jgi:hypothetical protein
MRYSLRTLFLVTPAIGALLAIMFRVSESAFGFILPVLGAVALNVGLVALLMATLGAVERFIRDLRR